MNRLAIIMIFFCSCASVKKTERRMDSTVVRSIDSVRVTFYDSVTKVIEKEEYFTKTITYYDTLWVTKDSMITIPKYTETWTSGSREKQSESKLTKSDSANISKAEEITKTIVEKDKKKMANNFYKFLFFVLIALVVIYIYTKLKK